jgi:hypothetical protein
MHAWYFYQSLTARDNKHALTVPRKQILDLFGARCVVKNYENAHIQQRTPPY